MTDDQIKKSNAEKLLGFERSIKEAAETVRDIMDPNSPTLDYIESLAQIEPDQLYSKDAYKKLTAGEIPLGQLNEILSNLNFWRFFQDAGFFDDSEADPEKALPTVEKAYRILFDIIDVINRDQWRFAESVAAGEITLKDVGITEKEYNYQKANLHYADIPEAYEFLYSLATKGVWPLVVEVIEEIPLAQYSTDTAIVNHALVAQCFKKAYEIAKGDSGVIELKPRGGRSNESYELSGVPQYCRDYFKTGAGDREAKAVFDAVISLIKDEQAIECKFLGRVWLTPAAIVEKVSETTAGTIRGRDNKQALEIVNAALLMMREFSIVGRNPSGMPIETMKVIDAERKPKIICNGNTYYDVWGFRIETYSIDDYAKELKHRRGYPKLQSPKNLSFSEGAIKDELLNVLHHLRGDLYTTDKSGNPKPRPRKSKAKINLSWPGIFDSTNHMRELDSRQKQKVVKEYEKVLKLLAEQDAHNELVEGRPLYINAYSERNPGKGRGKGAWKNLVIEATNEFHTPTVDLFS